ncbi:class III signal peptide-containing protein [Candidatus Micrarchaeota archaeon]|nr:class III signal peptide-containing protein [Candidatus Micrarchaeota archaeon]
MRKGQSAIEYLVILAAVIIIALIVISVIGGFPGMTRGVTERDSASYWTSADIGIVWYFISATPGTSVLVIRNNRVVPLNVTSIKFGGTEVFSTPTLLSPASSTNITLTNVPSCTPGQSYVLTTVITYKDVTYRTISVLSGEKPLVGTCQP